MKKHVSSRAQESGSKRCIRLRTRITKDKVATILKGLPTFERTASGEGSQTVGDLALFVFLAASRRRSAYERSRAIMHDAVNAVGKNTLQGSKPESQSKTWRLGRQQGAWNGGLC